MAQEKISREELLINTLESFGKKEFNKLEFDRIFKNLHLTEPQIEEIFNSIDKDKNQKIEFSEILKYFKMQEKKLKELFDTIDDDKSGKISIDELKFAFSKLEFIENHCDEFFNNIMTIYDKNNDGYIDYEEWKDILYFIPNVTLNYAINWSMNTTASLSFLIDAIPLQLAQESSKANTSDKGRFLNNFISGGLSAAIGRTFTAPLDRLKTLYQLNYKGHSKPPSLLNGLKEIIKNDGVKGLFRGNFVNILKASPDASIKLGVFEALKKLVKKNSKKTDIDANQLFLIGSISGMISSFCVYPMDVVKVRIAGSPSGTYNGIYDVIKIMYSKEGGIKSFFKGYSAAFSSALPNSGMNLTIYEMLRQISFKLMNKENLPIPIFMGIGAVSASITTTFLYPFSLLSARMMMQGIKNSNEVKLSMMQMMKNIYVSEGSLGFYKGFSPTISKIFIGNSISFGAYEFCKKLFIKNK